MPYMWAALIAFAVPWPLIHWTWMPVQSIYMIQLGVFAGLTVILHYPTCDFPSCRAASCGTGRIKGRCSNSWRRTFTRPGPYGRLIFVSVAERYAEIVVDCAVHERVPDEEWKSIIDKLTADIGRGQAAKGLIEAIPRRASTLRRIFRHLRRKRTFYRTTLL